VSERTVKADGIEFATQAFGDAAHPAILLIMGAMASMLWWPEDFCKRIAAEGRYVIRYDNRDTGRSTTYKPGKPPYTFDDMADDAIRVLDGYGIAKAHIVGMSLGGMIGQLAALKYPSRVLSITAISTTPVGVDTSVLPQTTEAYMKHVAAAGEMDWSNRDQVISFMVRDARMLAGTAYPHDELAALRLIERDLDRATNFKSATNHFMLTGGEAWKGRLRELQPPLLVIHGTADPIFPVEHGALLAETVPGAKLLQLDGGGNELNKGHWDEIIEGIVKHTDRK
jgi:pimeloyl-ACP methyl ester carboxylesterase